MHVPLVRGLLGDKRLLLLLGLPDNTLLKVAV